MKLRCLVFLLLSFVVVRAAAQPPVRVFLAGDSTCAAKDLQKQNPERGWGQMLPALFDEGIVVLNYAVNGRSTRSFRDEGRWETLCEQLQEGDYVFIQFGHNDQKSNDPARYSSPEEYAANLRGYVREVRDKRAFPVLLTPVVRRRFVDGVLTGTHGDYPAAVHRVAAEEQVPLIDVQALTRDWIAPLGDEASKAFFMHLAPGVCPLWPDGRDDDTHLSIRGARSVARIIAAELPGLLPELGSHLTQYDLVVAQDGSGDFFTFTDAVASVPDFGRDTTRILICAGTYREKVVIPATKQRVRLDGRGDVMITWSDYALKIGPTGLPLGTSGTATVYFGGDGWTVYGITFENAAGRVGQAVAVQCLATELHFIRCRFLGNQDTLYLYGVGNREGETVRENSRMTFCDCYIEGTTDFIFGSASALFRRCEIRSKSNSYVTAASTCRGQACGLLFDRCRLTADEGASKCYLGRPWREYAQTVFIGCYLGAHIRGEGWHDWSKPRAHKTAFYAEYGSEGPGAVPDRRAGWSRQLTRKQARRMLAAFEK